MATKRVTKVSKTRKFRVTKKNPKGALSIMRFDLGTVEQQITVHFPKGAEITNNAIPKERNPDLISFYWLKYRYTWRKDLNKGAIFDNNGIYSGNFDKADLKLLFSKIGDLLKEIKS